MNAEPLLAEVARALQKVELDAVLIGNAAAALHGAPVSTIDFDFMFRATPRNMTKLKRLARMLKATILRPYYPASDLYRVVRDDDGLQVDFMGTITASGRSRACATGLSRWTSARQCASPRSPTSSGVNAPPVVPAIWPC